MSQKIVPAKGVQEYIATYGTCRGGYLNHTRSWVLPPPPGTVYISGFVKGYIYIL